MLKSVHIIGSCNGAGIERDTLLLKEALQRAGMEVHISDVMEKPLYWRAKKQAAFDANLFIEKINPYFLPAARRNFFFPNQEIAAGNDHDPRGKIDVVLAKTRHAEQIYAQWGKTHFVGFTSHDRYLDVPREPFVFHMTSKSNVKGSERIFAAWKNHADLPKLVALVNPMYAHLVEPLPHVEWITQFLPDEELRVLQNRALVHLFPSGAEGFGHVIAEGLSTGNLVITTDGPPMNELVTEERGVLCPWENTIRLGFGQGFFCSPEAIAQTVRRTFALPEEEKLRRRHSARAFFTTLTPAFQERLSTVLFHELQ